MSKANQQKIDYSKFDRIGDQVGFGLGFGIAGLILADFLYLHFFRGIHSYEDYLHTVGEIIAVIIGFYSGMLVGIGYNGYRYLKAFDQQKKLYKCIPLSVVGLILSLAVVAAFVYAVRNTNFPHRLENQLWYFIPLVGAITGFNFLLPSESDG